MEFNSHNLGDFLNDNPELLNNKNVIRVINEVIATQKHQLFDRDEIKDVVYEMIDLVSRFREASLREIVKDVRVTISQEIRGPAKLLMDIIKINVVFYYDSEFLSYLFFGKNIKEYLNCNMIKDHLIRKNFAYSVSGKFKIEIDFFEE